MSVPSSLELETNAFLSPASLSMVMACFGGSRLPSIVAVVDVHIHDLHVLRTQRRYDERP